MAIDGLILSVAMLELNSCNFFLLVDIITAMTFHHVSDVQKDIEGTRTVDSIRASLFTCKSNPIVNLFFSNQNIEYLQSQIRIIMKEKYNYPISKQSETELVLIMRGIFNLYESNIISDNIPCQIRHLNARVLEYVIPQLKTNIDHYVGYLRDTQRPHRLLDRPQNTSLKGEHGNGLFQE